MKKIVILLILLVAAVWALFQWQVTKVESLSETITHRQDYTRYLKQNYEPEPSEKLDAEITFWLDKLDKQPEGFLYMEKAAALLSRKYKLLGNLKDIQLSDSLLHKANTFLKGKKKINNYLLLSANAIGQHRFQQAKSYVEKALNLEPFNFSTMLMAFDAYMETGAFEPAENLLKHAYAPTSFDYLIRAAKFQDHQGNLDSALFLMEKAQAIAAQKGLKDKYLWVKTNLGDMYGHAGQFEKSYHTYLEVLDEGAHSLHAMKGIAWLAFSHDLKTDDAKEILSFILTQRKSPDVYLTLAEIAEFENDRKERAKQLALFEKETYEPGYFEMYRPSRVALVAEEEDVQTAIALAQDEINNRSTPSAYLLLARTYARGQMFDKALAIVENHVVGETFEPSLLYQSALIYQSAGLKHQAEQLFEEALQSSFELGPVVVQNIRLQLTK
ncbi:hypothetical protein AAG747_00765 [Rapidithrix thailandica]|uniref:Tetratricopeptide repeat protein n=1 Tax=Rapidithrix thailandica TaxID=413964 RepID=A0AAW9S640_9BACT